MQEAQNKEQMQKAIKIRSSRDIGPLEYFRCELLKNVS
jgi:hypothetical protein